VLPYASLGGAIGKTQAQIKAAIAAMTGEGGE